MEGTRNEKIIIVISAYVIGFTTAFIAFGLKPESQPAVTPLNMVVNQQKEVRTEVKTISGIGYNQDGLYADIGGYQRILSAIKNNNAASVYSSVARPGYYTSIQNAEASPNGQFAYYCEQQTAQDEDCLSYMYALSTDTVYPVLLDGKHYKTNAKELVSSWDNDGAVHLNSLVSVSAEKPWLLAEQETTATQVSEEAEPQATSNTTPILPSEMPAEAQAGSALRADDQPQLQ